MSAHIENSSLSAKLFNATEVKSSRCYQCGKCSAGCPVAIDMDFPPSVIMRMLQTENPANDEIILRSYSIWMCLTCEMCFGRCPMEIDIPKVMDYLGERSFLEKKVNKKASNILKFHQAFLKSIKNNGLLSEVGLIANYKMSSLNLMQDMDLAPKLLLKGKLHFIPNRIKDRLSVRRIFNETIHKKRK